MGTNSSLLFLYPTMAIWYTCITMQAVPLRLYESKKLEKKEKEDRQNHLQISHKQHQAMSTIRTIFVASMILMLNFKMWGDVILSIYYSVNIQYCILPNFGVYFFLEKALAECTYTSCTCWFFVSN